MSYLRQRKKCRIDFPNEINVKIVKENRMTKMNLFISILLIIVISVFLVYCFNYKEYNGCGWIIKDIFDVSVFAVKDLLYSSLFISLCAFIVYLVNGRKK